MNSDQPKPDLEVAQEVNDLLDSIATCIERGEGKGKCHVFIDRNDICQCGKVDLAKARMK